MIWDWENSIAVFVALLALIVVVGTFLIDRGRRR
jgi:hypothetical protein